MLPLVVLLHLFLRKTRDTACLHMGVRIDRMPCRQKLARGFAHDLIIEVQPHAIDAAKVCPDEDRIIIAGRLQIFHTDLDDRKYDSFLHQLIQVEPARTQILHPRLLKILEVVRMMHHLHAVSLVKGHSSFISKHSGILH